MSPALPDDDPMELALRLAARGQGAVEPNPMVGCVLVAGSEVVGRGWHQQFGGPHAEVVALQEAGPRARGATAYVTLEPCSHHGKTPPCGQALIEAGVARVVAAMEDPNPQVSGQGIAALREAGIECEVGHGAEAACELMSPYLKLTTSGRPWVIAKWAMSLDGKIATREGDSQWISGEASRAQVHEIRGRMDAVIVGAGTLLADDPRLDARPPGPRTPTRVVVADARPLPADRVLFNTPQSGPVIVFRVGGETASDDLSQREAVEVVTIPADSLEPILDELGRRRMTNVLVEGGGKMLGALFDQRLVDEAHVYIAPRVIGGAGAPVPIAGDGVSRLAQALELQQVCSEQLGEDLHLWGRVAPRQVG